MTKVKTQKSELPIASQSSQVENYIMWLRTELRRVNYGKVGLVFTVHDDKVVRVNQTKDISCKAGEQ